MSASNDMFTDDGAQSQHATKELTMISTISKTDNRYVVGGKNLPNNTNDRPGRATRQTAAGQHESVACSRSWLVFERQSKQVCNGYFGVIAPNNSIENIKPGRCVVRISPHPFL